MDAEDDLVPANSYDSPHSGSNLRSSSLSLSQNSPSIPAEGDWVEAADLDGDRWVKAEDMDDMWGDAGLPSRTVRVNDLDTYPSTLHPAFDAPPGGADSQQPAVDFDLQSRANSTQADDIIAASAPQPKRARKQSSPVRFKPSQHASVTPFLASHHALTPAEPSIDPPGAFTLSSPHPSKDETLFTEQTADSEIDSEDDTGSSGDVSASLRQFHAARQAYASSPYSIIAGSVSGDDNVGSQEGQASSHGFDSDEDSESSDGFEGVPSHHCINCMSRMYLGDVLCMDCGHAPSQDDELFDQRQSPDVAASAPQRVVLAYDERMTLHVEGQGSSHPERPDRIRAVMARLRASGITDRCLAMPVREATAAEVSACHGPDHMTRVASKSALAAADAVAGGPGRAHFSPDTYLNQHTLLCARLAAGACADVAAAVVRQEAATGVAIVRPPGHHAESNTAMGFCFFNNAAIAARAAQAAGAERVLILDWDVHHGNGTQEIFEEDPTVMYMSIHRHDRGMFYPGTGAHDATGTGPGEGFSVNVPWLTGGMGNGDYMAAFQHVLLPIAYEFNPILIIVSAGFDAAIGDPIGGCKVTEECFGHMTAMLQPIAPMAVLLEGGYNLSATAAATEACLRVLLGERPAALPFQDRAPSASGMAVIQNVIRTQAKYWRCLSGLVPPAPSTLPVRTDYRMYPQVNTLPAATHFVAVPAHQTPHAPEELSPADNVVEGKGGVHADMHQPNGKDEISEQEANDDDDGIHRQPQQIHDFIQKQHGAVQHASASTQQRLHDRQSDSTHDSNHHQAVDGGHVASTASESAVRQSPVHKVAKQQQSVDHHGTHGHRLLADGQESQAHAAKGVHRSTPSPQMCQSKSHQRLLLMRALHVSAHKMKRQQKHASQLHARAALEMRRQKSI
ncbi:TPA: hypothetical protein ACH3X3_000725 [Trebouxia sp. C0006]